MTREEIQQQLNSICNSKISKLTDKRIETALSHCKPIYQYDLEGNYLASYESIAYASYKLGVELSDHMASHNKGQRSQIAGYVWRYEKHDKIDVCLHAQKQKVNLYDLNGKLVKSFDTIAQLTKFLYPTSKKGMSLKSLQQNIKKKYVIKKV